MCSRLTTLKQWRPLGDGETSVRRAGPPWPSFASSHAERADGGMLAHLASDCTCAHHERMVQRPPQLAHRHRLPQDDPIRTTAHSSSNLVPPIESGWRKVVAVPWASL